MSSLAVLAAEPKVSFPTSSAGLWDAIVGKLALNDPAGSRLGGSSWPEQPSRREPGMFDLVAPAAPVARPVVISAL
jgi:hypothetical protein